MLSAIAAALPSWKIQHLAVWQEWVDVKPLAAAESEAGQESIMMLEEESQQAKFKAMCSRIA